jgi:hypothetical protein
MLIKRRVEKAYEAFISQDIFGDLGLEVYSIEQNEGKPVDIEPYSFEHARRRLKWSYNHV